MPAWLLAAIAWLADLLRPYLPLLGAGAVGVELQKGAEAQSTLDRVHEADEAAAVSRGWSRADRLRWFAQRRRLRDLS